MKDKRQGRTEIFSYGFYFDTEAGDKIKHQGCRQNKGTWQSYSESSCWISKNLKNKLLNTAIENQVRIVPHKHPQLLYEDDDPGAADLKAQTWWKREQITHDEQTEQGSSTGASAWPRQLKLQAKEFRSRGEGSDGCAQHNRPASSYWFSGLG